MIPDESASRESTALKDLPPSSEVYFPPEFDDPADNAVSKHFGKTLFSPQRNPFRFRTTKPQNVQFKKRPRLIKKTMVGRKLIRPATPKPKLVKQNLITFETSGSDNVEKIKKSIRSSKRKPFHSIRAKSTGQISLTAQNGGPSPDNSFRNPLYIETPPWEISSYSSIQDSSRVKAPVKHHQSTVPTPSILTFSGTKGSSRKSEIKSRRHKSKNNNFDKTRLSKSIKEKMKKIREIIKRRKLNKKVHKNTDSHTNNWKHFRSRLQDTKRDPESITKSIEIMSKQKSHHLTPKKIKNKSCSKRGKSLSSSGMPPSLKRMLQKKTGFPNLVRVPETNFECGNFRGGEYIADVDTQCQVTYI